MKIAPSLLAADMADLGGALKVCEEGGADAVHFDVMDGHFAPNLSFGIPVLEALAAKTRLPIDVHLMVERPERLLGEYLRAGAAWVSVHWEAARHLDRVLSEIREAGARAGVALNPATPVAMLDDCLHNLDFVLLMSVNPGFAGQEFLPGAVDKVWRLRRLMEGEAARLGGRRVEIAMDGGIGQDNIHGLAAAGVDTAIAGSAVFGRDDPAAAISALKRRAASQTT